MAQGNGKAGRELMLRMLAEQRQMQGSIEKLEHQVDELWRQVGSVRESMTLLSGSSARAAAIMEELVDHMGHLEARMDDFDARLGDRGGGE